MSAIPIPFLSRLRPLEYFALALSFTLLFLETLIRSITLLLPTPIIRFFYRLSRNAFNSLSDPYSRRARQKKRGVSSPLAQAQDFVELCELQGYVAEEHIVQTKDGYLLGLHRVVGRKEREEQHRVNAGEGGVRKKAVYLHHGLLMNSEVWVCVTEQERCLPFVLVEQGYDVWLGNNRGNKYSKKCLHAKPTEAKFWDFSMDQFAFHDIPDSINYILDTTRQPSLSYIGFSQGTAQAFATLSIHPTLNSKVDVFVALAPAMAPPGLASGIVASLCKSNPSILFLAFGRRAILGSATMWQALLYPAIFTWFIDKSLAFLFNWQTRNITPHQKLAAYPHLYSFTSTKCVVHWFQIIRNGTFQMYDDETTTPLAVGNSAKYYKVAKFPTRNIKTPIVLIYGGSDSLVDIKLMLKELPRHTVAKGVPKYEHLDLLWASDVDRLVFPHVLDALETYAFPEETKDAALAWRSVQGGIAERSSLMQSANGSLPPGYSDSERSGPLGPAGGGRVEGPKSTGSVTGGDALDETDLEDDAEENGMTGGEHGFTPAKTSVRRPATVHSRSGRGAGQRAGGSTGGADEVRETRSSPSQPQDAALRKRSPVPPQRQPEASLPAGRAERALSSPSGAEKGSRGSSAARSPATITIRTVEPENDGATDMDMDGQSTVRAVGGRKMAVEGWWSSTASSETGGDDDQESLRSAGTTATTALFSSTNLASAPTEAASSTGPTSPPLRLQTLGGLSPATSISSLRHRRDLDSWNRGRKGSDASSISERGIGLVKAKAGAVVGGVDMSGGQEGLGAKGKGPGLGKVSGGG
ncbi:hypothetical protein B0A50_06767 [Salinomyces thailandicus]|uniref:AB hydrolase-1 domain-containing protein n=1 Tax=Salinomyces thailandicus TaxID=706561 RepID=A0A4U0TQD4_9PEZI|nr:hypothetical protein B0A50_06767 [Salinomyces thailandica]